MLLALKYREKYRTNAEIITPRDWQAHLRPGRTHPRPGSDHHRPEWLRSRTWEWPSQAEGAVLNLREPITGLREPIPILRMPISSLRGPIPEQRGPIPDLRGPIRGLREPNSWSRDPSRSESAYPKSERDHHRLVTVSEVHSGPSFSVASCFGKRLFLTKEHLNAPSGPSRGPNSPREGPLWPLPCDPCPGCAHAPCCQAAAFIRPWRRPSLPPERFRRSAGG